MASLKATADAARSQAENSGELHAADELIRKAEALPDRLLDAGVGSLAFSELHLDDLIERGLATPMSYQDFELALKGGGLASPSSPEYRAAFLFNTAKWALKRSGCYLLFSDEETAAQVAQTLEITLGKASTGPHETSSGVEAILDGRVLFVPLTVRQLRLRPLGFNTATITYWTQKGFRVWLRPENEAGLTESQINDLFELWGKLPGVQGVIFGGALNEAIGFPDCLEVTAQALRRLHWKVGYIELPPRAQQRGIEFLVRALALQTVRVMAVPPAQQSKLSPERTLGMYSLGARERNLRVLYVRPYDDGKPQDDEDFLFALPAELARQGPASTFTGTSSPPSTLASFLMSLGAGALAALLFQAMGIVVRLPWAVILLALPVLLNLLAIGSGHALLFRSLLALAVGAAGPTLAFLLLVYPVLSQEPRAASSLLFKGLKLLVLVSACSVFTGLWVAALLTDTTFLLGLDRFKGVKLLTLGVPVLVVVSFLSKRYSRRTWLEAFAAPVRVYQAALVGVLGLGLAFLMLRTGNDAGAAASDSERYLRLYLDRALGVRPRFKEFLFAHPALVCLPLCRAECGFPLSLLAVLAAAIGQAGIVDTFAHVHTPLDITLTRSLMGIGFGGFVGMLIQPFLSRTLVTFRKVMGEFQKEP